MDMGDQVPRELAAGKSPKAGIATGYHPVPPSTPRQREAVHDRARAARPCGTKIVADPALQQRSALLIEQTSW
jgi:hypothetical protein